jgi:hypothetical protein
MGYAFRTGRRTSVPGLLGVRYSKGGYECEEDAILAAGDELEVGW